MPVSRRTHPFFIAFTALVMVIAVPVSVPAQQAEYIATHRDWHAFQYTENGNRVCYVASQPTREEGNYTQRGDVFVLVTHRPAEDSRNVVSFITGYTYEAGSTVSVEIDNTEQFTLITNNDTAWTRDAQVDQALVGAMRAGLTMVVRGTSSRGTLTTDTYSLRGVTAALREIDRACGL